VKEDTILVVCCNDMCLRQEIRSMVRDNVHDSQLQYTRTKVKITGTTFIFVTRFADPACSYGLCLKEVRSCGRLCVEVSDVYLQALTRVR
jgi:hypothetical protein